MPPRRSAMTVFPPTTSAMKKRKEVRSAFQKYADLNRYANIQLIDQSRVILTDDLQPDYIHANWVDGYAIKKAFILTQAPTEPAIKDYWRMIWQEKAQVIVCLTSLKEKGTIKADTFFPTSSETPFRAGGLRMLLIGTKEHANRRITVLHLRLYCWFGSWGKERDVAMVFYGEWPDRAVPTDAGGFLDLLLAVEKLRETAMRSLKKDRRPPIVVNCSAGVGRSGTFVACQVEVDRLRESGMIDPQGTVRRLRTQRSGAVQKYVQYMFICRVIMEAVCRFPISKDDG